MKNITDFILEAKQPKLTKSYLGKYGYRKYADYIMDEFVDWCEENKVTSYNIYNEYEDGWNMDFYKGIINLLNPDLFDYVEIGSDSQGTVGVYKNYANQIPRKQQLFIVDDGNAEQIIVCVPSNLNIQDLIDDLA